MSLYPSLTDLHSNSDSESTGSLIETNSTVDKMASPVLSLDMAVKLIPNYDGKREELQRFINSCEFALDKVGENYRSLLLEIIKNKITGKAYNVIRFRNLENWEALKLQLEEFYIEKRSIAHLQLELTTCRQKLDEDVRAYSHRIEKILAPLIDASIEGKGRESALAIQGLLKQQALNIFQEGLLQPLKLIVKAKGKTEFEDAVAIAILEECAFKSDRESQRFFGHKTKNEQAKSQKQCFNCGKKGHISAQCYAKKTSMGGRALNREVEVKREVHVASVVCHYCKKIGHIMRNCRKREYDEKRRDNRQQGNEQGPSGPNSRPRVAKDFKSAAH